MRLSTPAPHVRFEMPEGLLRCVFINPMVVEEQGYWSYMMVAEVFIC